MKIEAITTTIDMGSSAPITIETGKLAKQAHGSVVVRQGDTMLLATVVANEEAKEGLDFLPLTVEYREKYAAAGRFPGGYFKREARPYDDEILVSRLIDRALRPMFPDDFHSDTQVVVSLISADKEYLPEIPCTFSTGKPIKRDIDPLLAGRHDNVSPKEIGGGSRVQVTGRGAIGRDIG
jgi:polyribonucleotide nucleotidyltransferase